jgi:hypothetical protein
VSPSFSPSAVSPSFSPSASPSSLSLCSWLQM